MSQSVLVMLGEQSDEARAQAARQWVAERDEMKMEEWIVSMEQAGKDWMVKLEMKEEEEEEEEEEDIKEEVKDHVEEEVAEEPKTMKHVKDVKKHVKEEVKEHVKEEVDEEPKKKEHVKEVKEHVKEEAKEHVKKNKKIYPRVPPWNDGMSGVWQSPLVSADLSHMELD